MRYGGITPASLALGCGRLMVVHCVLRERDDWALPAKVLTAQSSTQAADRQLYNCEKRARVRAACWGAGEIDGSEVKSIVHLSRGPEFNFRQPRGGSRPSIM